MPRKITLHRGNIMGIRNPSIKRIANIAGAQRVASDVYNATRMVIVNILEDIMDKIIIVAKQRRRKTFTSIREQDVMYVINTYNFKDKDFKKCTYNSKQACAIFPIVAFQRLVREVSQEYADAMFQKTALYGIQFAVELLLLNIFQYAVGIARNAKRVTIMKKDILLSIEAQDFLCKRQIKR